MGDSAENQCRFVPEAHLDTEQVEEIIEQFCKLRFLYDYGDSEEDRRGKLRDELAGTKGNFFLTLNRVITYKSVPETTKDIGLSVLGTLQNAYREFLEQAEALLVKRGELPSRLGGGYRERVLIELLKNNGNCCFDVQLPTSPNPWR